MNCSKHGSLTTENSYQERYKKSKTGFRARCILCKNERAKRYYEKHSEEIIKKISDKQAQNIEKARIYAREFRAKNLEKVREKEREYWKKNKDRKREKDARYREKNRAILCEKNKVYKAANRDIVNAWNTKDRAENPEKHREYAATGRKKLGSRRNKIEIARRRGITEEQYNQMFLAQDNKCAICKNPEKRLARDGKTIAKLCVDHCHKTQKVRGLLCHDCNVGLGHAQDSIEILQNAIEYLQHHK